MSASAIDPSEYRPEPGHQMQSADMMGVFADDGLLGNNEQLASAFERFETDPRFDKVAIERRMLDRAEKARQKGTAAPAMPSPATSSGASATKGESVPDVIMFGFCKIVFNFVEALKQRFHRRKMIVKTYELFWQIAEQAPAMPYEKFRDLVYNVGQERAQADIERGDTRLARKIEKLKAKASSNSAVSSAKSGGDDNANEAQTAADQLRQLFASKTLEIFDHRAEQRRKLPHNGDQVADGDNKQLFDQFEQPLLRHAIQIPLFSLAKLDHVWCDRLDLVTRDCVMQYMHRLCKVTNLIDNFDPTMKQLINSVSIDSLKAVQGKSKGEIDYNALLDELQERVLNDDEFLDKVSEIAMKQADNF